MAASLSVAGSLGALNLSIVEVQVPVQALCESARSYPTRPATIGLPAAGAVPNETGEGLAYPVDVISIITDIQRSIDRLNERTASIPDMYTYYMPVTAVPEGPAYWPPGRPGPISPEATPGEPVAPQEPPAKAPVAGESKAPGGQKERAAAREKRPSPGSGDLDLGVRQSGLAVEQLKGDLLGVTRDLDHIEALIQEIVRLSVTGTVDVSPVPALDTLPGRPVADVTPSGAPYAGPGQPGPAGREIIPAERSYAGKAGPPQVAASTEFVRGLTLGAGLSGTLWGSTTGRPGVTAAKSLLEPDDYLSPAAGMPAASGIGPAPATPVSRAALAMAQASPIVQTIEAYNTIVNTVKDSAISASILPMRGAAKAEITRHLLAMPEQPADDRQIRALLELAATLQANIRPAVPAMVPPDRLAGADASGDISDLWLAVTTLQSAYDALRGDSRAEVDFGGLRAAVEGVAASATVPAAGTAIPDLSIAIEGVKTPGSRIELPDFSVVSGQFRQMETMMARLQVPMYAGGGTVTEPTLAFVAEAGPEVIVSGSNFIEFTTQIASLNSNYSNLWSDVQVLRDGIRELTASVNEALGDGSGGDGGRFDFTAGIGPFSKELTDRFLSHFHLSYSDLYVSSFKDIANTGLAVGAEYGLNVIEEKIFDTDIIGGEDESGSHEAGSGEAAAGEIEDIDKEEEEFWDLMDKIEQIETIRKKRKGKTDDDDE